MRSFFLYYHIGEGSEQVKTEGSVIGGDSIFGRMAAWRVKLNLTEEELMNKTWISLNMEAADFPWYDPKAKKILKGKEAAAILDKYVSK